MEELSEEEIALIILQYPNINWLEIVNFRILVRFITYCYRNELFNILTNFDFDVEMAYARIKSNRSIIGIDVLYNQVTSNNVPISTMKHFLEKHGDFLKLMDSSYVN